MKRHIKSYLHLPYDPSLKERARSLRKEMTFCERTVWKGCLQKLPYRFLRQKPIDRYIVDFYCAERKLVIEIDGESHYADEGKKHDAQRTAVLESYGLRILRFTNMEVLNYFEGVCQKILQEVDY